MRGFFVGTFALTVLYVLVQDQAAERIASGTSLLERGLRRALAPDVAGVPQRTPNASAGAPSRGGAPSVNSNPYGQLV